MPANRHSEPDAGDERGRVMMQAQLPLMDATEQIHGYLDAHPSVRAAGFSNFVSSPEDGTVVLYWVGAVPVELVVVIRSAQERTGAKITVASARYSSAELRSATDVAWAETDGVVFTSGAADGSGIRVTIDPDVFDKTTARRTNHPAVLEFIPGDGDGNAAEVRARQNAECRAALAPAAELWASFPANASPRPLVLLSGPLHDAGFVDVEAQDSFAQGQVMFDDSVPLAAVDAMWMAGIVSPGSMKSPTRVTAATLTTHLFRTDRGRQSLPAWELSIVGALGPSYLLTTDQQALDWSPPAVAERGSLVSSNWAGVDADGITVVYMFYGDSELCSRFDGVDIVETSGSVAAFPRLEYLPGGWRHDSLAAEQRTVTFSLTRPLGGRVLVDWHGGPVVVTPAQVRT